MIFSFISNPVTRGIATVATLPPSGRFLDRGLRRGGQGHTFDVKSGVTPGFVETSVAAFGFLARLTLTTKGARQRVSIQSQGKDVRAAAIEIRRTLHPSRQTFVTQLTDRVQGAP